MASGEVHVVPQGCPGSPSGVPCVQGQACVVSKITITSRVFYGLPFDI
jgi:hypothetical protein